VRRGYHPPPPKSAYVMAVGGKKALVDCESPPTGGNRQTLADLGVSHPKKNKKKKKTKKKKKNKKKKKKKKQNNNKIRYRLRGKKVTITRLFGGATSHFAKEARGGLGRKT